jgi:hypothetical protein
MIQQTNAVLWGIVMKSILFPTYRESERPRCPFCGQPFGRPPEVDPKGEGDFYKWLCPCGAVGAYDATGHNLGDALMEAIVFAYSDDWETALAMEADKDYEVRYLDLYHRGDHRVLGGGRTYKTGMAAFVFVRIKSLKHLH